MSTQPVAYTFRDLKPRRKGGSPGKSTPDPVLAKQTPVKPVKKSHEKES